MEAKPLDPIRHQVTTGDQRGARLALMELLEAEPDNADAWALLATLLTDPAEQAQCYREILRITPDDSQATAWLDSLTGQLAEQPTDTQIPSEESPAARLSPEEAELDQILDDIALPEAGDQLVQPHLDRETAQWPAEPKGFLDGLLNRVRGRTAGPDPDAEALVLGQEEIQSAAGALSPELILRLAGGPLAPEERRNCPNCGAVVSRREVKCPWCSAILPSTEGPE